MQADPVLLTPGSATWTTTVLDGGTQTVFTVLDDTVLDWAEFRLEAGSSIQFDVLGGGGVVNQLGGSGSHYLNGTVLSNGVVGFFSPEADFEVNGSITAKSVTLSTLGTEAADFLDGGGYRMADGGEFNFLTVNGEVRATGGDVVLAGRQVVIGDGADLVASGALRIAGLDAVSVSGQGARRLRAEGEEGFVLHLGEGRASRIEIHAGREVNLQGTLDAVGGRVWVEVGDEGTIRSEASGIIMGETVFDGLLEKGVAVGASSGDAPGAVSDGVLGVPALTRPDGTKVTGPVRVATSTAVGEAVARGRAKTVSREGSGAGRAVLQRSSFFGMRGARGGNAKAVEPEKGRR